MQFFKADNHRGQNFLTPQFFNPVLQDARPLPDRDTTIDKRPVRGNRLLRHGAAFALHNDIGCKWNEATYQVELARTLEKTKTAAIRELPITVTFGQFSKTYQINLLVSQAGVYELKAVNAIDNAHIGQVLNYLRLVDATRAKIVNFRPFSVESKFVNCNDTLEERQKFDIDGGEYKGPAVLRQVVNGMLRDLGTKLSVSLYNECVLANIGSVITMPTTPNAFVSQAFQMVEDAEAFTITSIESHACHHREHLRKMASKAMLNAFHWINVTPKVIRLETITP